MCLAIPTKIVKIENNQIAEVNLSGVRMKISLALLPEAKIGDYVLVHAGFAINVLSDEEAKETLKILSELDKQ
ncbi:MAG: HypC/HybG/HupF family hydrogenase formation chaperone [Actinobacteria bacterium]|nr:HypC/HybG/HupF family hydrogenase formation chaperone [Actinomycetota bacterium]